MLGLIIQGVATLASTGVQVAASRKQQSVQQEQQELTRAYNKAAEQEAAESTRREARVKQAEIQQQAVNAGIVGSSAVMRAQGQLSQNVALRGSQQAEVTEVSNRRSVLAQKSADITSDANKMQAGFSLLRTAGSAASQYNPSK